MKLHSNPVSQLVPALLITIFACPPVSGDLRLANIFGDNMVIQRDSIVPIWGWSEPGDNITVAAQGQSVATVAADDGRWRVNLQPIAAGDPFTITVSGSQNAIEIKNVLAGEVWICGGQSNMEWSVNASANAEQERAAANYPLIRHVKIARQVSTQPQDDVDNSGWNVCSPETVGNFTAVGYYFARKLHQETQLPIGLINCNWGGTIVEAWTSAESLRMHPDFAERIDQIATAEANLEQARNQFERELEAWQEQHQSAMTANDDFAGSDFDDSSWKDLRAPGQWEQQGFTQFDGLAWYRKQVEIPEEWVGQELKLALGQVDDNDRTFVNGKPVGSTSGWNRNRVYKIPADINNAARMSIAVQVHDTNGAGGIVGGDTPMTIRLNDESSVGIDGVWKFTTTLAQNEIPQRPRAPGFNGPNHPTALFNGMLHPVIPYAVRGAIWYQGESNAGRAYQYRSLFPLLIQDWRRQWQTELPFYWVQLANFRSAQDEPGDSTWAELREAQSMALALPSTGQAVIIDIGEANDIHPRNKQDVGKRLALHALNHQYGIATDYSGPRFRNYLITGSAVRIRFDFADELKSADGKPLAQFSIAGKDKKFVWANATIEGNEVVVQSDEVPEPYAVRYAWADNPQGCNLTNASGIPASPFRTDDWPGVTVDNK